MSTQSIDIQNRIQLLQLMTLPEFKAESFKDYAISTANKVKDMIMIAAQSQGEMIKNVVEMTDEEIHTFLSDADANISAIVDTILPEYEYDPNSLVLFDDLYISLRDFCINQCYVGLYDMGLITDQAYLKPLKIMSNSISSATHPTKFIDRFNKLKDGVMALYASGAMAGAMLEDTVNEAVNKFDTSIRSLIDSTSASVQNFINTTKQALSDSFGNFEGLFTYIKNSMGLTQAAIDITEAETEADINDSAIPKMFTNTITNYTGITPGSVAVSGAAAKIVVGIGMTILSGLCAFGKALQATVQAIKKLDSKVKEVYVDPMDIEKNSMLTSPFAKPSIDNFAMSSLFYNSDTKEVSSRGISWTFNSDIYYGSSYLIFPYWIKDTQNQGTSLSPFWMRQDGNGVLKNLAYILYVQGHVPYNPYALNLTLAQQVEIEEAFQSWISSTSINGTYCFKTYFGEINIKWSEGSLLKWPTNRPYYSDDGRFIWQDLFRLYKDGDTHPDNNSQDYKWVNHLIGKPGRMDITLKPYLVNPEYYWRWFRSIFRTYTASSSNVHFYYDGDPNLYADYFARVQTLNTSWTDKWVTDITSEADAAIALQCGYCGLVTLLSVSFNLYDRPGVDLDAQCFGLDWTQNVPTTRAEEYASWITYVRNHTISPIGNADFIKLAAGFYTSGTGNVIFNYDRPTFISKYNNVSCVPITSLYDRDSNVLTKSAISDLSIDLTPYLVELFQYEVSSVNNGLWIPYRHNRDNFHDSLYRIKTDNENIAVAVGVTATLITVVTVAAIAVGVTAGAWSVASSIYAARSKKAIQLWNQMSNGESITGIDAIRYWRYNLGANSNASSLKGLMVNVKSITGALSGDLDESESTEALLNAIYKQLYSLIKG